MQFLEKIWKWIDHNRFVVIFPVLAIVIWFAAASCTPQVASLLSPGQVVNERGLDLEYQTWQKQQEIMILRFEAAGESLEEQKIQQAKLQEFIISLASGDIADLPGLVTLLIGGGGLGAIIDNIRKRSLISGLKRNKE